MTMFPKCEITIDLGTHKVTYKVKRFCLEKRFDGPNKKAKNINIGKAFREYNKNSTELFICELGEEVE